MRGSILVLCALLSLVAAPAIGRADLLAVTIQGVGSFDLNTTVAPTPQTSDGLTLYGYDVSALSNLSFSYGGHGFPLSDIGSVNLVSGETFGTMSTEPLTATSASPGIWMILLNPEGDLLELGNPAGGPFAYQNQFNNDPTFPQSVTVMAVPEPGSLILLATSLAFLAGIGCWQRFRLRRRLDLAL